MAIRFTSVSLKLHDLMQFHTDSLISCTTITSWFPFILICFISTSQIDNVNGNSIHNEMFILSPESKNNCDSVIRLQVWNPFIRMTRRKGHISFFFPELGKFRGPGFKRTNEYTNSLKRMKNDTMYPF